MERPIRPREPVIVRAWGDEPVRLFVYRIENKGNTVFVGPDTENGKAIGLPAGDVFEFDDHAFVRLRSAYETGKTAELSLIYSTCIKYQNKVNSHA